MRVEFAVMAEIVNLRRVRKQKRQAEAKVQAAQNRSSFGAPKHVREVEKAARLAEERRLDGHRLAKVEDLEK